MGRSDFSLGISRSSLPPSDLPQRGPNEISWGKIKQCPAAPALTTPRPRSDIGRRVWRHANPGPKSLLEGSLAFSAAVRLRLPPHTPSRERYALSRGQVVSRAVAFTSWLPPTGPKGEFHPQSLDHAQHTSGYACARLPPCPADASSKRTTVPDSWHSPLVEKAIPLLL
jgi:hypothetical protein